MHTPEPWEAIIEESYGDDDVPVSRSKVSLGIIREDGESLVIFDDHIPVSVDDARLIAAAPELLKACKEAAKYIVDGLGLAYDEDGEKNWVLVKINQAITKAVGDL